MLCIGNLCCSFLCWGSAVAQAPCPYQASDCLIIGVALQREGETDLMVEEAAAVNQINRVFPEREACSIFHTS